MVVEKNQKKKGVIFWDNGSCQTCWAVLDFGSSFRLSTEGPVNATLTLKQVEGAHYLTIMER
jgi:hypothetical protein